MKEFQFKIYTQINQLPFSWNEIAKDNIFLQKDYLNVLEQSAPSNMQCYFMGVFQNNLLVGTVLAQFLNLTQLESFGERDRCLKTLVRNFIFKNFASHVLFIGNNMITGQNGFVFSNAIASNEIGFLLKECATKLLQHLKTNNLKTHLVTFKDFYPEQATGLKATCFSNFYEFNTQPNMIFTLQPTWKNMEDYVTTLTKKYRDQYKRAQKKAAEITTKELSESDLVRHENRIYELYHHVAQNAPFNTFFLTKNHFTEFKKHCGNSFKIFGSFKKEQLVGFHSILLNGNTLETYFLGYDEKVQKESMLYLNMLYSMTEFAIENNFGRIIFGRTALEIKSSIGAQPVLMSGFIYHTNSIVNTFLPKIFPSLEPTLVWQQRHPFK